MYKRQAIISSFVIPLISLHLMTPLLKFIVLCGVIETGILFKNFVSCNIFDCWELLHSSSRKPLDRVVTMFSFPEIFSLIALANLNGLIRVKIVMNHLM